MKSDMRKIMELNEAVQSQGSTLDQLKELHQLANQNGLYDAADLVRRLIENTEKRNV